MYNVYEIASHLARKFSMMPFHRTKKCLKRVATNTSSRTTHSQSTRETTKQKSYSTTPHGTLTWKLTWEGSSWTSLTDAFQTDTCYTRSLTNMHWNWATPAWTTWKVSSCHKTKHYSQITTGRKYKQMKKNAIAGKKINAQQTENALHKM